MNHTTDTQRTDAMPSNKSMLTAQSNPVELYQQLCKITVDFGKALDACVEYRKQLDESKAEVERLEKELAEGRIKDFTDTSTDKDVHIVIKGIDDTALQKSLVFHAKKTNMHAFNAKGVITKYETLNDILKEYADVRLALYETRRQHQIRALQDELPYHDNVVRFIEDQIADKPTIDLRRKSRAECDAVLESAKYTKLADGYEYILRLPVSSFTAEAIAKHTTKLEALRKEIAALQQTTASQMWLADLQQV